MNNAKLGSSVRLQVVLKFLKERGTTGATGREIIRHCDITALTATISELRKNNILIDCTRERTSQKGASVYRYRLVKKGQQELW